MVVTIIYTLQKAVCFLPQTALPWHIYSRLCPVVKSAFFLSLNYYPAELAASAEVLAETYADLPVEVLPTNPGVL